METSRFACFISAIENPVSCFTTIGMCDLDAIVGKLTCLLDFGRITVECLTSQFKIDCDIHLVVFYLSKSKLNFYGMETIFINKKINSKKCLTIPIVSPMQARKHFPVFDLGSLVIRISTKSGIKAFSFFPHSLAIIRNMSRRCFLDIACWKPQKLMKSELWECAKYFCTYMRNVGQTTEN